MSIELLDRTVHLTTRGGTYDGSITVVDARQLGDSIQLTGPGRDATGRAIPRTVTVGAWCIHDTRGAAVDAGIRTRQAIRERRLSSDERRALRVAGAVAAGSGLARR
jgi:hypothetical protein